MASNSKPTAIILAGGLGTRLRAVVEDRPKVLAEVNGHPFLQYLLDQLIDWQIQDVVLCTGYLGDQIESHFGRQYRNLRLHYSQEHQPLGTAGALRLAVALTEADTLLVLNGDSYCAADFEAFWHWYGKQDPDAALLLVNLADTRRFGRVQVSADGQIERFDEKDESASGAGMVNTGIYLIKRHLIENIPDISPRSLEREVFPTWIGKRFYAYMTDCPFLDIGTPESYSQAEAFLKKMAEPQH